MGAGGGGSGDGSWGGSSGALKGAGGESTSRFCRSSSRSRSSRFSMTLGVRVAGRRPLPPFSTAGVGWTADRSAAAAMAASGDHGVETFRPRMNLRASPWPGKKSPMASRSDLGQHREPAPRRPGEVQVHLRTVRGPAEPARLIGPEPGRLEGGVEPVPRRPAHLHPGGDHAARVHAGAAGAPVGVGLGDAALEEEVGGGDVGRDGEEPAPGRPPRRRSAGWTGGSPRSAR